VSSDTLKNRAVLAVYRNDLARPAAARLPHEISSDNQRLLVGERDALSTFESGQRSVEPRRAYYGIQDYVDVIAGSRCDQGFGPAPPGVIRIGLGFDHADEVG
jgi:hypothetical protein